MVLSFAIPKAELAPLLPAPLTLDCYEDLAFMAIALVETKGLRPKGFPKIIGRDFFLMGYRLFVNYHSKTGKKYRGLYILKSFTNRKMMELAGNTFTHYNYQTCDFRKHFEGDHLHCTSKKGRLAISIDRREVEAQLPEGSPFKDWKTARKFAGPLPFTFTVKGDEILIIQGVRSNWKPKAIKVDDYNIGFINDFKFENCQLANAFEVTNIPYYWKKAKVEKWK